MKIMQQFNNNASLSRRGFGILEVLIASSLLIIVIGGVSSLARSALRNNLISLQRAQAYNLAREAVESIRANRDSKWIDEECLDEEDCSLDWNYDFHQFKTCTVTIANEVSCEQQEAEIILDNTKFVRSFQVEEVSSDFNNKLADLVGAVKGVTLDNSNNKRLTKITVTVTWNVYGKERKVQMPFILSGWKPA